MCPVLLLKDKLFSLHLHLVCKSSDSSDGWTGKERHLLFDMRI